MTYSEQDHISPILTYIPQGAKVLDLGCGKGDLLALLKRLRHTIGYGIEIDANNVQSCISKGISVYQGNIDEGLSGIPDQSYDVVILSYTLQEIHKPAFVISEMLRVGKQAIITFPNFGHWALRAQVFFKGQTPVSKTLPFSWFNTPNIRVITIRDFRQFCHQHHIQIIKEIPLHSQPWHRYLPNSWSNWLSEKGMFVIQG